MNDMSEKKTNELNKGNSVCEQTEGGEKRSRLGLRTDSGGELPIKRIDLSTCSTWFVFQLTHTRLYIYTCEDTQWCDNALPLHPNSNLNPKLILTLSLKQSINPQTVLQRSDDPKNVTSVTF